MEGYLGISKKFICHPRVTSPDTGQTHGPCTKLFKLGIWVFGILGILGFRNLGIWGFMNFGILDFGILGKLEEYHKGCLCSRET